MPVSVYIALLEQQKAMVERQIAVKDRELSGAKEKLEQLEHKQQNHYMNAIEYDRRYKECMGE
ncbi:hypothetical protein [Magnetospira sp. QH-2]|uniref:hypothetical protein n=1 Tax=Magnetospira sp. (strain QH-2) TaxID=1288970 RepID=UPI0011DDB0A9|nr:hypothetical protein [Magnetospira sp. QH-2]